MAVILHTKAWSAPPLPPEMLGVPFEFIMAPYVPAATRVLGLVAKPLGIPAMAALGPQVAVGGAIILGASGVRHAYRMASTHAERMAQHKINIDRWLASLPPVRNVRAVNLAEIEDLRVQLHKGEFGVGSTIEIHGSVGRDFAVTYQAACEIMKKHDKYYDLKTIPFLIHDMFKLIEMLGSSTSLVVATLAQFHKVRNKLGKHLKHMHN